MGASIAIPLHQATAQTQGPTTLPPVTVEGKKTPKATKKAAAKKTPPPADVPPTAAPAPAETATGPVQNYVATRSASGTKTDTPLSEIPQSMSVVGAEQVRDLGAQALQETLRYLPGVVPDGFGLDSRGDYSLIRGIPAAYYLDGMRTAYGFYANTIGAEPYQLERIEVLRGPASMMYGQSPSGGLINMVSKMPQEEQKGEISIDYGNFDFRQVKMDMTGQATTDGKWLYRFVGMAREADTQVDFVDNDRILIAPSLTYRPTSDTSITVLGNLRRDRGGSVQQFLPHAGTLYPNVNGKMIPRSRFIGEPTDYNDTDQESVALLVDHKFSPWLSFHHGTRYTHNENTYSTHYTAPLTTDLINIVNASLGGAVYDPASAPFLDPNQQQIARVYLWRHTETDVITSDTNLTGQFFTGGVAHKLTGGFDVTQHKTGGAGTGILVDNLVTPPFGPQNPFDVYNPVYGASPGYFEFPSFAFVPKGTEAKDPRPEQTQRQVGIYAQDQLKFGPWTAVLGLRKDWVNIDFFGQDEVKQSELSGRAGLMYHFANGFTPYVSYSQAFATQPGELVVGPSGLKAAEPLKGDQVEVGFKYFPKGIPFMLSGAVFDLTEQNRLVSDILSGTARQGAEARIRGAELQATGKITENIKLMGGYSFLDAEYKGHFDAFEVGTPVEGVPRHMASLWAIYSVNDGPLAGLSFGAGVRYIGQSRDYGKLVDGTFDEVVTPSFTLFDAMIAYETETWRWQLVGTNLEDEYHVITCSARGDCGVGQARTIITSLTYKF